jgi:hypothetical protein
MIKAFTLENTEGYSEEDLEILNNEFSKRESFLDRQSFYYQEDVKILEERILKEFDNRYGFMKDKYEARVIGETSAGMSALEIYKNNKLVWSLMWFSDGASESYYKTGLRQIYETAMDCAEVEMWSEYEYDDEGNKIIIEYNNVDTTWVVASYTPESGWIFNEPKNDSQSYDFISVNSDRIPKDVLDKWDNFD